MPNRVIKESIKRSPQIDSLTWFEEVLFYRLVVTVDDYGCTDGRITVVKHDLFPTKESITNKAIEQALNQLEKCGLIDLYEVDGLPYIHLRTWDKHQRIRNKNRKYPPPPERTIERPLQKFDCHLTATRGQLTASCRNESESESESNPNNTISDEIVSPTGVRRTEVQTVIDAWNTLSDRGIAPISRISRGSNREKLLNARLRENGLETVLRAIDNVKQSDFLSGRNNRAWIISFDWFIKPSCFDKVLDGNYANHKGIGSNDNLSAVDRAFLEGAS